MDLRTIHNIQEEKDEESSSHDLEQSPFPIQQKQMSLMQKFDRPQSSISSENMKNKLRMRLHSSSLESNSNFSDKHNNRHHSSTENLLGNLTQKEPRGLIQRSEFLTESRIMRNPTENIIQVQETKFISQDDTTQQVFESETIDRGQARKVNANVIGKIPRSRNVMDPIKQSLRSSGTDQQLSSRGRNDLGKRLKLSKLSKKHTKKTDSKSQSHANSDEDTSDYATLQRTNVGDGTSAFNTGFELNQNKQTKSSKNSSEEIMPIERRKTKITARKSTNPRIEETKISSKPPKIMGFFLEDDVPGTFCSRNNNIKNAKSSTIHLFDDGQNDEHDVVSSDLNKTIQNVEPIKTLEGYENQIYNTLDSNKQREISGPESLKITDYAHSRPNHTTDNLSHKEGKRASSKNVTKINSNEHGALKNKFMMESEDSYNPEFELEEMDFRESKIDNQSEIYDKISDAAKTFRNLRSQLINKNNSEASEIRNQIINQSRNTRNMGLQMNSLSPKAETMKTSMFEPARK